MPENIYERRSIGDRRNYSPFLHIPERRKGKDRRISVNFAKSQSCMSRDRKDGLVSENQ